VARAPRDVVLSVLLPRAGVDAAGTDAATWGRSFAAVLVGLQGGAP
jgi:hypothetical protein